MLNAPKKALNPTSRILSAGIAGKKMPPLTKRPFQRNQQPNHNKVLTPLRGSMSRTGFVIFCANCPVAWQSKLQSTVSLSTTEAEHVALSSAMRDVTCLIHLIKEIKEAGIELPTASQPKTICRVFEDNVSALELANTHKLRP